MSLEGSSLKLTTWRSFVASPVRLSKISLGSLLAPDRWTDTCTDQGSETFPPAAAAASSRAAKADVEAAPLSTDQNETL